MWVGDVDFRIQGSGLCLRFRLWSLGVSKLIRAAKLAVLQGLEFKAKCFFRLRAVSTMDGLGL